ncbi:DUF2218 domain-containing protein [Halopseudomonas sabulinigri]|uniref:DUF2218 domain-containing protein n=1 Tax=Halopseudomonas sabulinigri TaxID=472181 RepID=A0ABP9ZPF9_9GAMM
MMRFQGQADTASAALYMNKLCKHFAHKVAVKVDQQQAQADFPFGHCTMLATHQQLQFDCTAADLKAAIQLRFVLDDHLQRFARREALRIELDAQAPPPLSAAEPTEEPSA